MKRVGLLILICGMAFTFGVGSPVSLAQDEKKPDEKKTDDKKPVEKKILERTVSEWIKILRSHDDPKWRRASVLILDAADVASTTALPAILDAAESDKEAVVRVEAVRMIGKFDPKKVRPALKALVNSLQNDKEGTVREVAAASLGNTRYAPVAGEYVSEIAGALKDTHEGTRIAVAGTLRNMGESAASAVPALLGAARDPKENLQVRLAAVHVVSRFGKENPQTASLLVDLAKNTGNAPALREISIEGLGRLGSDAAEVLAALSEILGDKNVEMRKASAVSLGALGPKANPAWKAIKPHIADQKEDSSVRNHLIRLTGVLGKTNPEAIDVLEAVAKKDDSTENRIAAIQELGELGPLAKRTLVTLAAIETQDARAAVREAAGKAVKAIRTP